MTCPVTYTVNLSEYVGTQYIATLELIFFFVAVHTSPVNYSLSLQNTSQNAVMHKHKLLQRSHLLWHQIGFCHHTIIIFEVKYPSESNKFECSCNSNPSLTTTQQVIFFSSSFNHIYFYLPRLSSA